MLSKVEVHEQHIRKALRKKPQTLTEIAQRIGKDTRRQHLAGAIAQLVASGEANKSHERPPRYSKP